MAGKWDESKVKRDKSGRFSRLSGSGQDKANQLKARNRARGQEVLNNAQHQQALDLMRAEATRARSSAGYQHQQNVYMSIQAAGNAPLRTPKGQQHRSGHAQRTIANNARGATPKAQAYRSAYQKVNDLGNAKGRAATANASRKTTKAQKSKAQRDYQQAARRFNKKHGL